MRKKEYIKIGKLNKRIFKKTGIHLITDKVIFTSERMQHVETKREKIFDQIKNILPDIIYNPTFIYKDWNNRPNTVVLIKPINKKLNLNIVLKIAVLNDKKHTKNSIITIIQIGDKTLNKIIRNKRENLLFEKIDKFE